MREMSNNLNVNNNNNNHHGLTLITTTTTITGKGITRISAPSSITSGSDPSSAAPSLKQSLASPSPNVIVGKKINNSTTLVLHHHHPHHHHQGSASSSKGSSATSKDSSSKTSGGGGSLAGGNSKKEEKEGVSIKGDLRSMMHAFGDGKSPLEESVQLMELILRQELMAFVFICDAAGYVSGTKALGLRECIYTLRNDKSFLARLFKYLTAKDRQQQQQQQRNRGVAHQKAQQQRNYLAEIKKILDDLDGTGELESLLYSEIGDDVNANKNRLISHRYNNYAKARSVSFARKLPQLHEWVSLHLHSDFRLTPNFLEVLAFLIYDLVAEIVDLSFIVKREQEGGSNPFKKLCDTRGSNPDTCMSAALISRKDEECNNVSEILVLASELEAKRLKKVAATKDNVTCRSSTSLLPCEIKEAYIRMQSNSTQAPSISFRRRAEQLQKLNFQY